VQNFRAEPGTQDAMRHLPDAEPDDLAATIAVTPLIRGRSLFAFWFGVGRFRRPLSTCRDQALRFHAAELRRALPEDNQRDRK
jgi:hypothetical protein